MNHPLCERIALAKMENRRASVYIDAHSLKS
jgi:hypothetical protein